MVSIVRVCRAARFVRPCLIALVLVSAGSTARAGSTTVPFAQFVDNSNEDFQFTNNGTTSTLTFTGGVTSDFSFLLAHLPGLPNDLKGNQTVTVTMNLTGLSSAATDNGGTIFQPLSGTISFTRTAPAAEGAGARTNLLTATFTSGPTLSGLADGTAATLNASNAGSTVVTYTSDFLSFAGETKQSITLSLNPADPSYSMNSTPGTGVQSFVAPGTLTFASNPAPTVSTTPEPSTYLMVGCVAGAATLFGRFRRRVQAEALAAA